MASIDDLIDDFALLGDWDTRYQYLVELGEQLPPMPDALKTEDNRVKACMSKLWISAYPDPSQPDRIRFHGDCDTAIIKGVLAVLLDIASGHSAEEIAAIDFDRLFQQLELAEHLSPNRHVGIYAIVDKLRQQADALANDSAPDAAAS